MAGRNDDALADALHVVARTVQHQPNSGENDGSRVLEMFQRNHPHVIKGRYDPNEV